MSRRKLTDTDRHDWDKVASSVRPLEKRPGPVKTAKPQQEAAGVKPKARASEKQTPVPSRTAPVPPLPVHAKQPAANAPGLDQYGIRKLKRGKGPDARIDLDGMTQTEAHHRLLAFLRNAQTRDARVVLVITGKGKAGPQQDWWNERERGVLRRAVPGWFSTPAFRPLVAGFQSASHGHGGEGAFFVQLRRFDRGGKGRP